MDNIPALERRITELEGDSKHIDDLIDALNELAWELRDTDISRSYECSRRAYDVAKEAEDDHSEHIAQSISIMMESLVSLGVYQETLLLGSEGIIICQDGSYPSVLVRIYRFLGWAYQRLGDREQAFAYIERQYQLARELSDDHAQAQALSNMAVVYGTSGDPDMAESSLVKAGELYEKIGDLRGQAVVLNNLAMNSMMMGDYEAALDYAKRALSTCREQNYTYNLPYLLETAGEIHHRRKEYDAAAEMFEEAISIAEAKGRRHIRATASMSFGRMKIEQGQTDKGLALLRHALEEFTELDAREDIIRGYEALSQGLEKSGDVDGALTYHKKFHDMTMEVYNERSDLRFKTMTVLHQTEEAKKEAEIHRLKNVELQKALDEVKTLSGLLPICSNCKKIRDDDGYWQKVEVYLRNHSGARFSHGICPDCMKELYPDIEE